MLPARTQCVETAASRGAPTGATSAEPAGPGRNWRSLWRESGPWLLARAGNRALGVAGFSWNRVLLFRRAGPSDGLPAPVIHLAGAAGDFGGAGPPDGLSPRLVQLAGAAGAESLPVDPLLPPGPALARLARGDELLLLCDPGGAVACRGWLHRGEPALVTEISRRLPLATNEAWLYDCATAERHRGRGLFPALLRAACALQHERAGGAVIVGALDWNRASVRAIRKAGFQPAGVLSRFARRG